MRVTFIRSYVRRKPMIVRRKGRIISVRGKDGKMHKVRK